MTRLLLVAAALVAVQAAAGVGAGATWDVYPGAGTPIQTAIDGAGEGDRSGCMPGRMSRMWMWISGSR